MATTIEYATKSKTWYDLALAEDTGALSVYVYDEIGVFGITAKDFISDVSSVADVSALDIHINSPGGDVFQGLAIYNYLKRHKASKTVYVDGMAGSIASIIAMAGDRVVMPDNAFMFVHNPWTMTAGNADDLRQEAAALEKMEQALINVYVKKTGLAEDRVVALMDEDTWLTASEAVELGFADEVAGSVEMAAKYNPALYKNIPVNIAMQLKGETDMSDKVEQPAEQVEEAAPEQVEKVAAVVEPEEPKAKADQPKEVETDEPAEIEPEEPELVAVAEEQTDVRAEFKQFVDRFGNDRAAEYFAEGLSFADAKDRYLDELTQENKDLKSRVKSSDPAPVRAKIEEPKAEKKSLFRIK